MNTSAVEIVKELKNAGLKGHIVGESIPVCMIHAHGNRVNRLTHGLQHALETDQAVVDSGIILAQLSDDLGICNLDSVVKLLGRDTKHRAGIVIDRLHANLVWYVIIVNGAV